MPWKKPMLKTKQEIRKEIIKRRNALSFKEVDKAENNIAAAFWGLVPPKAAVLHTYIPINKEASTLKVIKEVLALGWTVVVPKTLPNRKLKHLILTDLNALKEERFGTLIPQEEVEYTGEFDYILVPGVGFSPQKDRMGYGGGYYDTFISQFPNTITIGVGYQFQLIEKLPIEEYDVPMKHLIII